MAVLSDEQDVALRIYGHDGNAIRMLHDLTCRAPSARHLYGIDAQIDGPALENEFCRDYLSATIASSKTAVEE